jgi:hypothetical protein
MYINFIKNTDFDFQIKESNQTNCSLKNEANSLFHSCLPFKIANSIGWDIILPFDFNATLLEDNSIKIEVKDEYEHLFSDKIGNGILAMQIPFFIECSKDSFIHIRGPINIYKENLYPLEAFVESDWFHSYMTMNWKIIEKNKKVEFLAGESMCRVIPYPKKFIQQFDIQFKQKKSILDKIQKFNFINRFSNNYSILGKCYQLGIDGNNKVDNIKKIEYNTSKCPFLQMFKKND